METLCVPAGCISHSGGEAVLPGAEGTDARRDRRSLPPCAVLRHISGRNLQVLQGLDNGQNPELASPLGRPFHGLRSRQNICGCRVD